MRTDTLPAPIPAILARRRRMRAAFMLSKVELWPGMRVLDLGCGRAMSSVFLRRELGVEVLYVGIEGVHPPVSVADAFQSVIGATEEKEAAVLQARAAAIKTGSLTGAEAAKITAAAAADALRRTETAAAEADRIVAGHPWVYGSSILRLSRPATDGELVQVKDHRQRLLGTGFFNSRSKIQVRLLSSERVQPDLAFFEARIRAALEVRRRHLPTASSFRVVNAESDFLSGLIVDKYEDVLVVQISSLGMDQRKSVIVEALRSIFSPRAILERGDMASRKFEGLPEASGILHGELKGPLTVQLNGLKFETDLAAGHKTGLYLDQQTNYQRVAGLAATGQVTILTKEEVLALGLLGDARAPDYAARLGDVLVLPHGSRRMMYDYQARPHTAMRGRHGGPSPEEMLVPLLVF